MKGLLLNFAAVLAAAGLSGGCSTTQPATRSQADYRLPVPQAEAERAYLGLPATTSNFRPEDIHCEILVIDCFDMYCHVCQTGAKHVNELYELTQRAGLGNRIKFIGLGVGDTPLEVATYKEKLRVPFPLFPDRRALLAKHFGQLKLPNLLVLRNQAGRLELLHRSSGVLLSPAKLLSQIQADLTQIAPHHWTDTAQAAQPTCEAGSAACQNTGLLQPAGASSSAKSR